MPSPASSEPRRIPGPRDLIGPILVGILAPLAAAQEVPGLRDDLNRRTEASTAEKIARERPGSDEWEVEALNARASELRGALLDWIADPQAPEGELETLLDPEFTFRIPSMSGIAPWSRT